MADVAVPPAPYPRGIVAAPDAPAALASANAAALAWTRDAEAPCYPGARRASAEDSSWPTGLPRLCLALSSGGLRAAAVGIGVLRGLSDADRLEDVDLVSGVSGGAFAVHWLHGNAFLTGAATDDPERPRCTVADSFGGVGMSSFDLVTKPVGGNADEGR